MKKNLPLILFLLIACRAEAGSVQFSTYYPAPFGMYDRLRLVPRAALGASCDPGTFYYETGVGLKFCDESAAWGPLGGSVWTQSGNNIYPADTASNPNLMVGIGTTSPGYPLDVAGAGRMRVRQGTNGTAGIFLYQTTPGDIGFVGAVNDNDMGFWGSSVGWGLIMNKTTGNVGIGTTTPSTKLDVTGAIKSSGINPIVQAVGAGTTNFNMYRSDSPPDHKYAEFLQYNDIFRGRFVNDAYTLANDWLNVTRNPGTYTTQYVTFPNGNVGIGTTTPAAQLDVNGTVYTSGPNIEIGGSKLPGPRYAFLDLRGDDLYTDYGLRLIRGNTGPNTYSIIGHRGTGEFDMWAYEAAPILLGTSNTERMRIDPNGNVGIGTSAPGARLEVWGTGGASRDNGIRLKDVSSATPYNIYQSPGGQLHFEYGQTSNLVTIDTDGNVGIGTTSPTKTLDVNGTIAVRGGPNYTSGPITIPDHGFYVFSHNLGYIPWCLWTSSTEDQVISIRIIDTTRIVLYGWSPGIGASTDVNVYCW